MHRQPLENRGRRNEAGNRMRPPSRRILSNEVASLLEQSSASNAIPERVNNRQDKINDVHSRTLTQH